MKYISDRVVRVVLLVLLSLLHLGQIVTANWWLLGTSSVYPNLLELQPTTYREQCDHLHYLVKRQQEMCSISENILRTVGNGAKMGIDECQHQFRMNRWNCTTFNDTSTVFGGVITIHCREKAYVYAISASGVAYSITRACSRGEITECGCDEKVRSRPTKGKWEWGGCSEDIKFGAKFSKEFVDAREDRNTMEGLMNLHNNEAGRRVIRSKMELVCKCHGVSGSCVMKACWRKMAHFREIGDELSRKFEGASLVKLFQRKKKQLRPPRKDFKKPSKKDLVFLEESPDYCERNDSFGVLGTKSRACNKTSYGMDGCKLLCCGRGYQTVVKKATEKCNCKFVWCCKVQCENCTYMKEEHFCN